MCIRDRLEVDGDLYPSSSSLEEDKKALAEALTEAHKNMKLDNVEEILDSSEEKSLAEKESDLNNLEGQIAEKAKDLDLDLDFLDS